MEDLLITSRYEWGRGDDPCPTNLQLNALKHLFLMATRFSLAFILTGLLCAQAAMGHPISLSGARVDITQDRVIVHIKLLAEDLFLFHPVMEPDEQNLLSPDAIRQAMDQHRDFLTRYFHVLDANGVEYRGEVTAILAPTLPTDGLLVDDLMKHSLTYRIEYPLKDLPEYLTFHHDIGGEDSFIPALMDLKVFRDRLFTNSCG